MPFPLSFIASFVIGLNVYIGIVQMTGDWGNTGFPLAAWFFTFYHLSKENFRYG